MGGVDFIVLGISFNILGTIVVYTTYCRGARTRLRTEWGAGSLLRVYYRYVASSGTIMLNDDYY